MQVTIEHRFTSLNEYILAERTSRFRAADIKKRETEIARLSVIGSRPIALYPVEIICQWFRTDQRTDPDNIEFAVKFILDGFVKAGLLKSDGWKFIKSISHEFTLASHDYVIVDIQ